MSFNLDHVLTHQGTFVIVKVKLKDGVSDGLYQASETMPLRLFFTGCQGGSVRSSPPVLSCQENLGKTLRTVLTQQDICLSEVQGHFVSYVFNQ